MLFCVLSENPVNISVPLLHKATGNEARGNPIFYNMQSIFTGM
jgi:hypothetical protein